MADIIVSYGMGIDMNDVSDKGNHRKPKSLAVRNSPNFAAKCTRVFTQHEIVII